MIGSPAVRRSISVLAGTNGAGKSSVAGAAIRARGGEYFNPDEAARRIHQADPEIGLERANSRAWLLGRRLLEHAIARRSEFAFETTLGGTTIPELLARAHAAGLDIRVWYMGLDSPERHIARVKARVEGGGHDIPEDKIRERYDRGRKNLIRLLPIMAELWIYDNSEEGDPRTGGIADPRLLLHAVDGLIVEAAEADGTPAWAKPIIMAAQRQYSR